MREVTPEAFKVYTLDELEPAARASAIDNVRHQLTGPWWDADSESISDEIVHGFAEAIGFPGWDKYGPGDFPGIDGVELVGWDLDRGDSVALRGVLTPANAPALPWGSGAEEISAVHLDPAPHGGHTYVGVAVQDDEGVEPLAVVRAMQDAVTEAMFTAKRYGRAQLEYLTGDERAEEDALANEREFTADGQLYQG